MRIAIMEDLLLQAYSIGEEYKCVHALYFMTYKQNRTTWISKKQSFPLNKLFFIDNELKIFLTIPI